MDHYRTFCIPTGFSQYKLMSDPIISRISNLSTLINAKLDKPAKSSSKFDPARAYCANNLNATTVKSDEILIVN